MPVEIRELVIKVTVNQQQAQTEAQSPGETISGSNKEIRDNFINQCVEQVLEILNNKKER